MKVTVDSELCTGCGPCEELCPEVFVVDDNVAKVKENPVAPEHQAACRQAAKNCPADAICLEE